MPENTDYDQHPETEQVQATEAEEVLVDKDLEALFKLPQTKELNLDITKYIIKNSISPFKSVELNEESDSLEVDLDKEFEEMIQAKYEDSSALLGDYFSGVITQSVEGLADLSEEELAELKEMSTEASEKSEAKD